MHPAPSKSVVLIFSIRNFIAYFFHIQQPQDRKRLTDAPFAINSSRLILVMVPREMSSVFSLNAKPHKETNFLSL